MLVVSAKFLITKQKDLRNLVPSLSSCVNDYNAKLGGAWKQAYDLSEYSRDGRPESEISS